MSRDWCSRRSTHRRREFTILAESAALAAAGGAAGLLLAVWIIDLIAKLPFRTDSLYVPFLVPRTAIGLDLTGLAFTVATAALTALLFGLAAALPMSRATAADTLRAGIRATPGRWQQRARSALVAVEIALSVILLVTAGGMIRASGRSHM
jgi:putative ABC transport system permease protein